MVDMARQARFSLGRMVITATAAREIAPEEVAAALRRHVCGDWGELDEHDRQVNEDALRSGERLLSVYTTREGVRFYVITERGREFTTVMLPEDY